MRIAFDAKRLFLNNTGLGNYSRTLVRNLSLIAPEHQYFLYTPKIRINKATQFFLDSEKFHIRLPNKGLRPFWRQWGIGKQLEKDGIDIYHGLSHEIPFRGVLPEKLKTVVTIHDLIFLKYPQLFPWIDQKLYQWKYHNSALAADQIIAISQSTKQDILELWKINQQKVDTIYQSCNPVFYFTPIDRSRKEHFLYVGSLTERKGLHRIIQAMQHIAIELQKPLVVIGTGKDYEAEARSLVDSLGLQDVVLFKGNVPNQELINYYDKAIALIYPSIYEGFGIPILEANLRKVPVICSNTSSMPEAGGEHALYVNPYDVEAIYQAMKSVILHESKYVEVAERSYDYAKSKFTASQTTQNLLKLYERLLRK